MSSSEPVWTESIGYTQFAVDSYDYLYRNIVQLWTDYKFPQQFFVDIAACTRNNNDPYIFLTIAFLTVAWTVLRNCFTKYFIIPITKRFKLPSSESEKLPECAWKFFYYSITWSLAVYILVYKEKGLHLIDPTAMWKDYQFNRPLPNDYKILFMMQLSFYLHSVYATLVMDRWRKDSFVLILHHVITVSLVFFTFSIRAHPAATVTFFLHDICDVWLEGTKCVLYFKTQDKKEYLIFEHLANVGFIVFTVTWFCSRLYTFPLRLVWFCALYVERSNLHIPLMFFLNSMLYLLIVMNFYWFSFIVRLLVKVALGNHELEDSREYEEEKQIEKSNLLNNQLNLEQNDYNQFIKKEDLEQKPIRASTYALRKRSDAGARSN